DTFGRPRHDASARTLRCSRHRRACVARNDAQACATVAARLQTARVLFRADVSEARRQALLWHPDPRRGSKLRPRRVPPMAIAVDRIQSAAAVATRLSDLARLPLRVRDATRDRRDQ